MKVKDATGISIDQQRLLFASKELEDIRNGQTMTFENYGIRSGATVVLVVRLPGGC